MVEWQNTRSTVGQSPHGQPVAGLNPGLSTPPPACYNFFLLNLVLNPSKHKLLTPPNPPPPKCYPVSGG